MNRNPIYGHRAHPVRDSLLGTLALATTLAALASGGAEATGTAANPAKPARQTAEQARGMYLMSTSGCMDCHTPWKLGDKGPEPDMTRLYSGHPEALKMPPPPALPEGPWIMTAGATNTAWAGPWGVSFTANLTPDIDTGLGRWSEADFIRTIRTGRHMGRGREVLPPMPIMVYNNFTDRDLKAIFAYLRSLPPIRNKVPDPIPPAAPSSR
jgi:mono/diheme cytochrome c family protein